MKKRNVPKEECEIQRSRVSIRLVAPYSEERRKAASEYAKKNGIHSSCVVVKS